MASTKTTTIARVPMRDVGPLFITGPVLHDEVMVPLATYESPLWPSVDRGARLSMRAGGIRTVIVDERMARSILVEAPDAERAADVATELLNRKEDLQQVTSSTSRFARVLDVHIQQVAALLYIRFEFFTGDAAGHNMVTKAADRLMSWILDVYPDLSYVSISGNVCTDKKNSAVNGILGRGKNVIAEMIVPRKLCSRYLKTTPEAIVNLNIKKNLLGSLVSGGVRTANAHFANMLLGFYLATGQDAANIVEGSQGFTHADMRGEDLYFSTTLPNLIVGTIGNGKDLDFVKHNLDTLGCDRETTSGANSRRLAAIAAAVVWCGELSLLAAQTNQGELMSAHERLERR